jgi:hypothetical protein
MRDGSLTLVLGAKRVLSSLFLLDRYPLNLYLSMLEEVLLSFSSRGTEYFYEEWKRMPEKEFIHLSQHYDLCSIEKVIVVGAGAVPYTALFFSRHFRKPVYAIERNAISYYACSRLVRKLNATSISVIKESGELYRGYENSLVIIVLHTRLKQDVLDKAMAGNSIVVVRVPLTENKKIFESVNLEGTEHTTVEHTTPPMVSIFVANPALLAQRARRGLQR